SKACDEPLAHEPEDDLVYGREDGALFDAHGREVVHVEEAPVVYLVGGDAPEAQSVSLLAYQSFEQVEALGSARFAVEALQRFVYRGAHLVALLDEVRQTPTHDLLLAPTLAHARGVCLRARRKMRQGRDDAFEF